MRTSVALTALLATRLVAQSAYLTCVTDTPVAVLAAANGLQDHVGVAAGHVVTPWPGALSLRAFRSVASEYATASTLAWVAPGSASVTIQHRGFARGSSTSVAGTSASSVAAGAVPGACAFRLTLTPIVQTRGFLAVSWSAQADPGASVAASIDVDADGSIEWSGGGTGATWLQPVQVGTQPIPIRVVIDGRAIGDGSPSSFVDESADLVVAFLESPPSTCTFGTYGSGCGPTLSGTARLNGPQHELILALTGAAPGATVISIVGERGVAQPLPGGCTLLSTAQAIHVVQADALGAARDTHYVPATALGAVHFQMLPFEFGASGVVLTATNGLRLDCAR